MKENVIDVLMFLFDNYLSLEEGMPQDEISLAYELREAGFETQNINKAFDWLGQLADIKQKPCLLGRAPGQQSMRFYSQPEISKLNIACRGFLLNLEGAGLLEAAIREVIIDRVMAIDVPMLSLQQFKRIVGLIMINHTGQEEMLHWVENLVCDQNENIFH